MLTVLQKAFPLKYISTFFFLSHARSTLHVFLCALCCTCLQTHTHTLTEVFAAWEWVPLVSWGPTPALLLHSSSAPLSRGNELLTGGRAHNGTSHNATFTGPCAELQEQSANQTLSGHSLRGQLSIVVQEEDRGNNNQLLWLSDFSSFSFTAVLNTIRAQRVNFLP